MKRSVIVGIGLAGWMGTAGWAATEPAALLGASALIARAQAEAGQKTAPEISPAAQARADLRRDLAAFHRQSANLEPRAAASAWLDLVERFWSLPVDLDTDAIGRFPVYDWSDEYRDLSVDAADEAGGQRPLTLQDLLKVLPGPGVWSALSDQVNARPVKGDRAVRDGALRVLVCFLNGDPAKVTETIKQFETTLRNSRDASMFGGLSGESGPLRRAWNQTKGFSSPADVVRQFREALEQIRDERQGPTSLEVPPLVDLTTPAEADELLLKCLLMPGLRLEIRHEGATMERLKVLALEHVGKLPAPRWELVRSVEDAALFEALNKQFAKPKKGAAGEDAENSFVTHRYDMDSGVRRRADQIYRMALLKAGRVKEAFAFVDQAEEFADDYDGFSFGYMANGEIALLAPTEAEAGRLFEALAPYAAKNPDRFPWSLWLNLGLMSGRGAAVITELEAASAQPALKTRLQLALLDTLASACLATDRVDEALSALRRMSALDVSRLPPNEQRNLIARRQSTAIRWMRLGQLLKRPELLEQGISLSAAGNGDFYGYAEASLGNSRCPTVLGSLVEAGRYAEAEQRLLETLTRTFKSASTPGAFDARQVREQTGPIMGALLSVYAAAGRSADALWLLDESPWWSSADLGNWGYAGAEYIPTAGRVLVQAGRKAEAENLLKAYLRSHPADDRGYDVLVSLAGADLPDWLDELYARDRFEERPLIWKAVVQMRAGRLDEAETTIRQALKVDPTDGEQEAGQRVKGYAVLADILEAQKKTADAQFFRHVVQSVRVAEEGDALLDAGLVSRSLQKYEAAEGLFVDAYCVQWRLAERLWALGRFEEANRHYAIAFERMPEQFGQVASFCFGCQGVFEKQQSRSVAENVLTRLATTQGQRPQVFFLLGQLREAQHRYADAYRSFKRAVELDPDYLDAWERLYRLKERLYLPKQESDDIVFRGMELDPWHRHFSGGWETVVDVRRLWTIAARTTSGAIATGPVFELKGTARAISSEQAAPTVSSAMGRRYSRFQYGTDSAASLSPNALLLRHQMVQALIPYLQ